MATITVKESGGNYDTLAAALSNAAPGDTIEISGTWSGDDTAACTVADDNITIEAVGDSRHPGYVESSPSHYRLAVDGSHCITVNNTGCTIEGLVIKQAGTGGSDEGIRMAKDGGTLTVKDTIIWASNNTEDQDGIYAGPINCTINLEQVIIYGFGRAGCNSQMYGTCNDTQTWNLNSCVLWNNGRYNSINDGGGIVGRTDDEDTTQNINIYNTISIGNDTQASDDYHIYVGAGAGGAKNWDIHDSIDGDNSIASCDASASGCLASRTETDSADPGEGDWVIFEDITSSPYDLRLQSDAENDAQDMHSNASGAGLNIPDDDIVGTSRPQNTNYDCGAFEYSSGEPPAGNAVPIIMALTRRQHG